MAAELVVRIVGDSTSLRKELDRSTKASRKFGRDVENAGRGAAVAAVGFHGLGRAVGYASASFLGAAGLVAGARAGFDELFASQKVAAQTAAALQSTGNVAGVTADQINELAGSLQQLTGYDDEAIQSAENLLLTFTNVRNVAGRNNDVFNQATEAALNLSRTFDQDLGSSAVQLGKALQDPVRGVTALRRIGVSFTTAQQKLINRLVSTGRVLEAQKIILREVNRETGNSARAYGQTLPGKLDILRGNLQNLAGELAATLAPELQKLTTRFNAWLADPENKKKIINDFAAATHALGVAAKFAAGTIGALKNAWDKIPNSLPGKNEGLWELLGRVPGGHVSGLDLLRKLGIGGGGGGGGGRTGLYNPFAAILEQYKKAHPDEVAAARGGGAKPPGVVPLPPSLRGPTATQRNAWFDAMINRQLGRVQDIASVQGQIARLKQIAALVTQRIATTKDITRKLKLEDQVLSIMREIKGDRAQQQQDLIDALTLNVDRAGLTATLNDDIAALQAVNAALAKQNQLYGVTRDREQQIIANEAQILALRQQQQATRRQARDTARQNREAAQQAIFDQLQFNVDRTALTKSLQDDLKALQAQRAGIEKIIATEGSTLARQQALLQVELAINAKNQEIADARKARTDQAKQAAADATQRRIDAANLQIARAQLTDTLRDDLAGQQNLLAVMKRTHASAIDIVNQQIAVKDAKKQLADQIAEGAKADEKAADSADRAATSGRRLFRTLNSTAFIRQFGGDLTRSQKLRLQTGLAMMGPGGTLPRGRSGQFTAGVTINGGVHMHGVQDVPGLENQLAKRAKARPHVRRGARG